MTQDFLSQAQREGMTYEMFLDCGRSQTETARQTGLSRATVRRHVRAEVRRRMQSDR